MSYIIKWNGILNYILLNYNFCEILFTLFADWETIHISPIIVHRKVAYWFVWFAVAIVGLFVPWWIRKQFLWKCVCVCVSKRHRDGEWEISRDWSLYWLLQRARVAPACSCALHHGALTARWKAPGQHSPPASTTVVAPSRGIRRQKHFL